MRVLVISGYFEPVITPRAFRTTELVKELSRKGHTVTLYIPQDGINHEEFEKKHNVVINYYKQPQNKLEKSSNKLLYILERCLVHGIEYPNIFMLKTIKKALKNEKREYDLLISIAAPHPIHWAVGRMYKAGFRLAKTWVADCGDPYMLCGTLNIKHPFYLKYFEKIWCKQCDYITVPTQGAIDGYYPEFKDKIRVIPQAFNFDEIERVPYVKNPVPTFVYSGSIWSGNKDPRPFLDYLLEVKNDFRFYVFTGDVHILDSYKVKLKEKLIVSSFIPRLELIKILSSMDFLVHFEFHTSVQTPSKLIDYTLSGRPILSINIRNMNKEVIQEFMEGDYAHQYVIDDIQQYNIKNVAQRFLDLCK